MDILALFTWNLDRELHFRWGYHIWIPRNCPNAPQRGGLCDHMLLRHLLRGPEGGAGPYCHARFRGRPWLPRDTWIYLRLAWAQARRGGIQCTLLCGFCVVGASGAGQLGQRVLAGVVVVVFWWFRVAHDGLPRLEPLPRARESCGVSGNLCRLWRLVPDPAGDAAAEPVRGHAPAIRGLGLRDARAADLPQQRACPALGEGVRWCPRDAGLAFLEASVVAVCGQVEASAEERGEGHGSGRVLGRDAFFFR
mmetsp:Transcript_111114/g.313496  ORF Transcript_111114/g.313496 Transcript_111114/m.313496 type:complete len:251 (-) Transcript_111114:2088-2840(-)